ncbi:MAG: hypothetical protein RSA29_15645 [Clostridium sp.]
MLTSCINIEKNFHDMGCFFRVSLGSKTRTKLEQIMKEEGV